MISRPTRRTLSPVLSLIVLGAAPLAAQVQVTMEMAKTEFVVNEAVQAVLTLTNHAGRDLTLHSEGSQSWLDFIIKNERGVPLSPIRGMVVFPAVRLPAGRSVSKTFTLSHHYRVDELGRYGGYAVVRLPGIDDTPTVSNRVRFQVMRARVIYRQKVGVPGSGDVREYRVMSFTADKKSRLYVEVGDQASGRTLRTYPLGEALLFQKPTFTVDGANNLHVLYLTTPSLFNHSRVGPDGEFLGREFVKRGATTTPRLLTFANGEVRVAGGVPFDPAEEQANRNRIRRLSERPPFAFR